MIDTSLTNRAYCVMVLDENKKFCHLLDFFGDEYYVNFATAQIVMEEYENKYDEDVIVAVVTDNNWAPEYDEKNIIKSRYVKHK